MKKLNRKKNYFYLGLVIMLLVASVVFYVTREKFRADTTTLPVIENSVSGTYSSESGSGQIEINTATIPVDMGQ